jgi:hypothetical protein
LLHQACQAEARSYSGILRVLAQIVRGVR